MRGQGETIKVGSGQYYHGDSAAEELKAQAHSGNERLSLGRKVSFQLLLEHTFTVLSVLLSLSAATLPS